MSSLSSLRRALVLAAAGLLAAPLLCGPATAAQSPRALVPAAAAHRGIAPPGGLYVSPWGSADVALSAAVRAWLTQEGAVLGAIAPFTLSADGSGYHMPIGTTAGDHLDSQGRIFYPGGMTFTFPRSGHTVTLQPTYIRVFPTVLWSTGVLIDGKQTSAETEMADTSYSEVVAHGRPTPTGFQVDQLPFHLTQDAADLMAHASGDKAPAAGTLFGTLTPHFDYVPPAH